MRNVSTGRAPGGVGLRAPRIKQAFTFSLLALAIHVLVHPALARAAETGGVTPAAPLPEVMVVDATGNGPADESRDYSVKTTLSLGYDDQQSNTGNPTWGGLPTWYGNGARTHFDRGTNPSADGTRYSLDSRKVFASATHHFDSDWTWRLNGTHAQETFDDKLLYIMEFPDATTGEGVSGFGGKDRGTRKLDSVDTYASGPFALFGRYPLPTMPALTLGGGANGQNRTFQDATGPDGETARVYQGSMPRVNLFARYRVTRQLAVQANVDNLFDRTYYSWLSGYGAVDVVVNNAGYGLQGTVEALTDAELRRNFDVNVFAPLNVLRKMLPQLRRQRSGHVINIASIVGCQGGYAGWGSYVATKFALAGLTESLAAETRELGIKATVIYPGPVRTDFLADGSLAVAHHAIDDYTAAQASLDLHLGTLAGNQAGDPDKLAELIVRVAAAENPPLHLFPGNISWDLAYQKLGEVKLDLAAWKDASLATDFPR